MTKKLRAILEEMENSCDSQQLAVAECLTNIAENGDEQEEDSYLVGCAGEIRDAAQSVIDRMSKKPKPVKLKFFNDPEAVLSYLTGELIATLGDDLREMEAHNEPASERQELKAKIHDIEAVEGLLMVKR